MDRCRAQSLDGEVTAVDKAQTIIPPIRRDWAALRAEQDSPDYQPGEQVGEAIATATLQQKVDIALELLSAAAREFGEDLVIASSLGKDSTVVWDLAQRVISCPRCLIVTTPYKPQATKDFMHRFQAYERAHGYDVRVFQADKEPLPPAGLYNTDPDRCCDLLKVEPLRRGLAEMGARCWVTGLRATEGYTRREFRFIEERDKGLIKLNPILPFTEREIWQYIACRKLDVNPLYELGYRSLGCEPCTDYSMGADERSGRWKGRSKCGGECGIHTRPLTGECQCNEGGCKVNYEDEEVTR